MNDTNSNYKKIIIPILIIILIITVVFLCIYGLITGSISNFLTNFSEIVAPITIGFIIAYLSNPVVIILEKYIFRWISNFKARRFFSVLLTILLFLALITTILLILVPNLIDTIITFWETYIVNYEDSITELTHTINSVMDKFSFLNEVDRIKPESLIAWIQEKLPWFIDLAEGDITSILPNVSGTIAQNISSIFKYTVNLGASVFNTIKNFIFGIFIAFYMLMSKERCKAYIRRFLNSFLSPKKVRTIIRFGKLVDRSFGGFIEGQLLDALIVGAMSYFTFIIFGFPIPHLLATIIATTNIIPILGPFLGGIPATFLVLLTAPEKTILFILLIIIIQQIDGNIICPNILGDKINISSLATMIAVITMGGLFGIAGMIIGVPIFAVAIHLINDFTMNSLRKKGLETSLDNYYVGNVEIIKTKSHSQKNIKSMFKKSKNKTSSTEINNKEK